MEEIGEYLFPRIKPRQQLRKVVNPKLSQLKVRGSPGIIIGNNGRTLNPDKEKA